VWCNGTSFGLNDIEALSGFTGKPPALRGLPSPIEPDEERQIGAASYDVGLLPHFLVGHFGSHVVGGLLTSCLL
jgi:hypothetical protein